MQRAHEYSARTTHFTCSEVSCLPAGNAASLENTSWGPEHHQLRWSCLPAGSAASLENKYWGPVHHQLRWREDHWCVCGQHGAFSVVQLDAASRQKDELCGGATPRNCHTIFDPACRCHREPRGGWLVRKDIKGTRFGRLVLRDHLPLLPSPWTILLLTQLFDAPRSSWLNPL